jgi:hypothetical protein
MTDHQDRPLVPDDGTVSGSDLWPEVGDRLRLPDRHPPPVSALLARIETRDSAGRASGEGGDGGWQWAGFEWGRLVAAGLLLVLALSWPWLVDGQVARSREADGWQRITVVSIQQYDRLIREHGPLLSILGARKKATMPD